MKPRKSSRGKAVATKVAPAAARTDVGLHTAHIPTRNTPANAAAIAPR
jgi:hypothetical protein